LALKFINCPNPCPSWQPSLQRVYLQVIGRHDKDIAQFEASFIAIPISKSLSQDKFDLTTNCGNFFQRRLGVAGMRDLYQVSSR
jgi:hypothetical protein